MKGYKNKTANNIKDMSLVLLLIGFVISLFSGNFGITICGIVFNLFNYFIFHIIAQVVEMVYRQTVNSYKVITLLEEIEYNTRDYIVEE